MRDPTQEKLAEKLGTTRQTVISVEKNKYDPSPELAFKMTGCFFCLTFWLSPLSAKKLNPTTKS